MVNPADVGVHHAKVVNADMCELRAAGDLSDRPNASRGRAQSLIDLDVSTVGELHAGYLQAKPLGVWSSACRNQRMTALQRLLSSILLDDDAHRSSRLTEHSLDPRIEKNVDALLLE